VDEAAISTGSQESATNLLTVTMHGTGAGMVEDLIGLDLKNNLAAAVVFEIGTLMTLISGVEDVIGLDLKNNLAAAVVFEIGTLMTLISGDCAGNVSGITDMIGQGRMGTIIITPTDPSKTSTGQTC
jgi:hypothetical protein